jgi:hypothetical protein
MYHTAVARNRVWHQWLADEFRHYVVRVRGTKFLWGSAGVTRDVSFASPLLLHIRNSVEGQPVSVGTQTADGKQTTIAVLQAGETLSIAIQDIIGVFATCTPFESEVDCAIKA